MNSDGNGNIIRFDIASAGVQTIALTSPLPALGYSVLIDGTTESGYGTSPLVVIDGSGAGSGSDGLTISGGDSTIRGLAIVGFSGGGRSELGRRRSGRR